MTDPPPPPRPRDLQPPRRADAGGLLLRQVLRPGARGARSRPATTRASPCRCSARPTPSSAGSTRRSPSSSSAATTGTSSTCARCTTATRSRPWEVVLNRGPVRRLRPPRDALPRRAGAAHPRRHQHPARGRSGPSQAGDVLPGAPRPLAGADRRRLRRAHRRRDRRLDRRAGVVVGQRRDRHGAARPDRGVRRRHRARVAEVRRAHGPASIRLVTLVDFENDCVRTSLELADALGDRALRRAASTPARCWWTESVLPHDGPLQAHRRHPAAGAERARRARRARGIRMCGSSCRADSPSKRSGSSRRCGVPVDAYGVGSSLFQGRFDFTADVVRHEGKPCAKVGPEYRPSPRLERVRSDA